MTARHPPILIANRIKYIKKSVSKKNIFDLLTQLLSEGQSEVSSNTIFDALITREKLGNTSIGNNIAIPRSHIDIIHPRAALLVLKNPFKTTNTADKKGIRFFLALLIPEPSSSDYFEIVAKLNKTLAKHNKLDTLASAKKNELLADYINSLLVNTTDVNTEINTLKENQ